MDKRSVKIAFKLFVYSADMDGNSISNYIQKYNKGLLGLILRTITK